MHKHTCLTALAILALATTAFPIELGLDLGTRPLLASTYQVLPYEISNNVEQAFGYHVRVEIPVGGVCQLSLRVGGVGGLMNTVTMDNQTAIDSLRIQGFEAHGGVILLVPVSQDGPRLSFGVGAGYSGSSTVHEYGNASIRVSYDGLVTTLSAGTRFRLSKLVSAGVEVEVVPASVLFLTNSSDVFTTRKYIQTQLGAEVSPTLGISVLVSL